MAGQVQVVVWDKARGAGELIPAGFNLAPTEPELGHRYFTAKARSVCGAGGYLQGPEELRDGRDVTLTPL